MVVMFYKKPQDLLVKMFKQQKKTKKTYKIAKGLHYRRWFLIKEDPMSTYRPLNEKFQNGPILTKSPYYRPWFFLVF